VRLRDLNFYRDDFMDLVEVLKEAADRLMLESPAELWRARQTAASAGFFPAVGVEASRVSRGVAAQVVPAPSVTSASSGVLAA
jgi:hypothetical protein